MTGQPPGEGPRARLLLYSMYDLAGPDRGPVVRIERMGAALGARCELSVLSGGRAARVPRLLRWLAKGGLGSIDGIYVEASSSFATPVDLAFLALARLRGRPVGVYFRDAYQLFRKDYPLRRRRQHLLDWLWRLSTPLLKRVATRQFAPSAGLAQALGLRLPVLLPPGTDPGLPILGPGSQAIAAYVGALSPNLGMHLLVDAVELVRREVPEARLRLITPGDPAEPLGALPAWIEWLPTGRAGLADALRDVAVCVIPFRITRYLDLAVPLKLMDYLAFGKPIVATACAETAAIVGPADAGLVVSDDPPALAAAITRVIRDPVLAARLAASGRALAEAPASTWGARADTVLETLFGPRPAAG